MSARPIIGRTANFRSPRTPRTLGEAFGPHASYTGLTTRQERRAATLDRVNGVLCVLIVVCLAALAWGGAL